MLILFVHLFCYINSFVTDHFYITNLFTLLKPWSLTLLVLYVTIKYNTIKHSWYIHISFHAYTLKHIFFFRFFTTTTSLSNETSKIYISVCFSTSFFLCQFSVHARIFNNAKVFETQSIRCTTVAPETTKY